MRVRTLKTIQLARVMRAAGSLLDLGDVEAQQLIDRGAAEAVSAEEVPVREPEPDSAEVQYFRPLNATDAIAYIATVRSAAVIADLDAVEQARPKGPRKTVLTALEAREQEILGVHVEGRAEELAFFASLDDADAIAFVRDVDDSTLLVALGEQEYARAGGARADVTAAIRERLAELHSETAQP